MRTYPRVSAIPADQVGALAVGVLASVGLYMLGNLATSTLGGALLLLAGAGVTVGGVVLVWYFVSVLSNLAWWFKCRRLDREEALYGRDY